MIFTERTITVKKGESTINEPVILYRGDYDVEVRFTIKNSKFIFFSQTNLIESEKAAYAQLAIIKPDGDNVFSDIAKCEEGTVAFVLTSDMIDELHDVGLYSFQIRLYDQDKESRASIPPVEYGIEIREPIASEDHTNVVDEALVGYSIAKVTSLDEEPVGPTFDEDDNYNVTNWETGDRITEDKLNKIEDALNTLNQNEKNLDRKMLNNYNVLNATKADKAELDGKLNEIEDVLDMLIGSEGHINSVDEAIVGYSIAKTTSLDNEPVGPTFDDEGNYNVTNWETGDRITEGKLNKIEDALDKLNQNEIADVAALDNRVTNNFNVLNTTKADKAELDGKLNKIEDALDKLNQNEIADVAALDNRVTNNFNVLNTTKADKAELDVERSRINTFVTLQAGSTTGDAELIDARVGSNGSIYNNLGTSIREQFNLLNNQSEFLCELGCMPVLIDDSSFEYGTRIYTSTLHTADQYALLRNNKYPIPVQDALIEIDNAAGHDINCALGLFTSTGVNIGVFLVTGRVYKDNTARFTLRKDDIIKQFPEAANAYMHINIGRVIDGSYVMLEPTSTITIYKLVEEKQNIIDRIDGIENRINELDFTASCRFSNISVLGDSITYGYGLSNINSERYTTLMANRLNTTVNNYGVSGSKLSEIADDGVANFTERVSQIESSSDLIVVFGGTNDYWHKLTDIGTIDSNDISTMCGALNYIIDYLQTNFLGKDYLFVFPFNQYYDGATCDTDHGHGTLNDFREAFISTCNRKGVPVLDLYSNSGMDIAHNTTVRNYYTIDGVHPNAAGHERLALLIANKINQL